MVLCPLGLESFPVSQVKWLGVNGKVGGPPPQQESYWGRMQRYMSRANYANGRVTTLLQRQVEWDLSGLKPHCPNSHKLPAMAYERPTAVVGLLGAGGSSKSHYVGLLVHSLLNGMVPGLEFSVEVEQESVDRYTKEYGLAVESRHVIEPTLTLSTEDDRHPITLVLKRLDNAASMNLVLYDGAGEQMLTNEQQARHNKFLYVAEQLLLFLPPAALPGFRGVAQLGDGEQSMAQTTTMFWQLLDSLSLQRRRNRDRPIDGSGVALVLSKADQVESLPGFNPRWMEGLEYGILPERELRERISREGAEIGDFIMSYGGSNLVLGLLARVRGLAFHALTATGCNPQGETYPSLNPQRLLDPLFGLLCKYGMIREPVL